MKKVAVLGGGNGAHTMAADLALKGLEVNLCESPLFAKNFECTLERQVIDLIDMQGVEVTANLHLVTTDFEAALQGVDYIMMAMSTNGHEHFFDAILPYLTDGQTIVTWPGYFSSLLFARKLSERRIRKQITLAESHTFPFACRLVGPSKVQVFLEGWRILVSSFPARNRHKVIEDLRQVYPVVPCENVLGTSLNDPNPIVHTIIMVLNAVSVERWKDFHFYRDGVTLPVARAIKAIYEEVALVAQAAGVEALEYPEESFWTRSGIMSVYFRTPFDKEAAAASIDGPHSLRHRFISEDVPFGLVPIALLARKFRVKVPVIDATITLSSVLNDTDYLQTGRSLKDLGLDELADDQISHFLENGYEY